MSVGFFGVEDWVGDESEKEEGEEGGDEGPVGEEGGDLCVELFENVGHAVLLLLFYIVWSVVFLESTRCFLFLDLNIERSAYSWGLFCGIWRRSRVKFLPRNVRRESCGLLCLESEEQPIPRYDTMQQ